MSKASALVVRTKTQADIIANYRKCSVKRIAWAYGCAKKNSPEEEALLDVLLRKVHGDTV